MLEGLSINLNVPINRGKTLWIGYWDAQSCLEEWVMSVEGFWVLLLRGGMI